MIMSISSHGAGFLGNPYVNVSGVIFLVGAILWDKLDKIEKKK